MKWWRHITTAALLTWLFAESDSDSGGSDSGDSDSGDSGLSVANSAGTLSSGDGTATNQGSSADSDSDTNSSDRATRPPGQPGATEGMSVGDLKDIPLGGNDSPIKK